MFSWKKALWKATKMAGVGAAASVGVVASTGANPVDHLPEEALVTVIAWIVGLLKNYWKHR